MSDPTNSDPLNRKAQRPIWSDASSVARLLTAELLRLKPSLRAEDVRLDASLTQDLSLDSLGLANLFAFIKSEIVQVDLTPWFLAAARRGSDSLGSLAEFLASRLAAESAA